MPKILVKQPFTVLMSLTERLSFGPGVHDVSDEVAEHWYVQEHSQPISEDGELAPASDAGVVQPDPPLVPAAADDADEIDAMTDEQLREFIKARDGRYPHAATGRDKLLASAKGDEAVSAEIEADEGGAAEG